jgi:Tfp pilus assembly protein PilF
MHFRTALSPLTFLLIRVCRGQLGDQDRAVELVRQALAIDPDNPEARAMADEFLLS